MPPVALAATPGALHLGMTPRPNGGLGVIGDSLTFAFLDGLDDSLRTQQWGPIGIEARSGRRTIDTVDELISATSGIEAIGRMRAEGFDASIWVIALGANDTSYVSGNPAAADALIDTMMAEIGADRRVLWVNLFANSPDKMAGAVEFNDRLTAAIDRHPLLSIADWSSLASANLDWFVDDVHTNFDGAIARNEFVAQAALVPRCPLVAPSAPPQVAPPPLVAATAAAVATQRCRV